MISFFDCVIKLGVGGVEKSALARVFQGTKECWISLHISKFMIVWSCWCAFDSFWFVFDGSWWRFSNDVNFSNKWKSPWRKLLQIDKSVVGEPIYNLVKINYVFIERFMCYVCFCDDDFFGLRIPNVEAMLYF